MSPWGFDDVFGLPFAVSPSFPLDSRLQQAAVGVWKALLSGPISLLHSEAAQNRHRVDSPESKKRRYEAINYTRSF